MYIKPRNLIVSSGLALMLSTMSASYATDASSQSLTDIRQEVQIWTTYALNPYLRGDGLKATVKNGKATLTGNVHEGVSKELAKEIALGVEGIKDVDNQINIVFLQSIEYNNIINTIQEFGSKCFFQGILNDTF